MHIMNQALTYRLLEQDQYQSKKKKKKKKKNEQK